MANELLVPAGLSARLRALYPEAVVTGVEPLRPDPGDGGAAKRLGYGRPLKVRLRHPDGRVELVVFHLEGADDFGHDRRADRAANVLLAWDDFPRVPHHVRALDVGAVTGDGALVPLREAGELYLLTEWAEGAPWAEDLRRLGATGRPEPLDLARVDALVAVLTELHAAPGSHPGAYVRAWRDLVGSGEGVAGIVDGYPEGVPGAPPERLARLEQACLAWRQRHRRRVGRLRRTHGDFHPFNIIFPRGGHAPRLLDASRGCQGEPADDVTCLAINFLLFGLEDRARWRGGLGVLWRRWWRGYLAGGDAGVLEVAAPFFAWRALVLCNPAWYPRLAGADRERLLGLAEHALAQPRFDPAWGEEAMR